MALSHPIPVRLPQEQLTWLDGKRRGPTTTRAQALRLVLDEAMRRELTRTDSQGWGGHGDL
jgi:hypothetical protein